MTLLFGTTGSFAFVRQQRTCDFGECALSERERGCVRANACSFETTSPSGIIECIIGLFMRGATTALTRLLQLT